MDFIHIDYDGGMISNFVTDDVNMSSFFEDLIPHVKALVVEFQYHENGPQTAVMFPSYGEALERMKQAAAAKQGFLDVETMTDVRSCRTIITYRKEKIYTRHFFTKDFPYAL